MRTNNGRHVAIATSATWLSTRDPTETKRFDDKNCTPVSQWAHCSGNIDGGVRLMGSRALQLAVLIDSSTGQPHIYRHNVTEVEVGELAKRRAG
jgi:hypothetical protein